MSQRKGTFEKGHTAPISLQVIRRIASAENIEPEDVPSLAERIDFEALDTLFASSPSNLMISFSIEEYHVEITHEETVVRDQGSR